MPFFGKLIVSASGKGGKGGVPPLFLKNQYQKVAMPTIIVKSRTKMSNLDTQPFSKRSLFGMGLMMVAGFCQQVFIGRGWPAFSFLSSFSSLFRKSLLSVSILSIISLFLLSSVIFFCSCSHFFLFSLYSLFLVFLFSFFPLQLLCLDVFCNGGAAVILLVFLEVVLAISSKPALG